MKKQDFIKAVAASAGLSQDAVAKVLAAEIDIITAELSKGGEVNITGFGVNYLLKKSTHLSAFFDFYNIFWYHTINIQDIIMYE